MLKVKDWLKSKNNEQFTIAATCEEKIAIVRRLSDGQIFYVGDIITHLEGATKFKIKSFSPDLIHVDVTFYEKIYTVQINNIVKTIRCKMKPFH